MVTNYYNSKNNFSSPVRREPKPHTEPKESVCVHKDEHPLQALDKDKTLILGLLAILYLTGCRDKLLFLALLFLLVN